MLLAFQCWLLPRLVLRGVEKALRIKISGQIQPEFLKTSFHVSGVQTAWNQKIRILSGRVDVDYDPILMAAGRLALRIQGTKVAAELLGDWAQLAGGQKIIFDDVFVNFVLVANGIQEIKSLRAESPSVHFSFGSSKRRQV